MKVFVQIGHGVIGAAVISFLCIWQAGSFGEARHTISIIGAYCYSHCKPLSPPKSMDTLGQSADVAQIPSAGCIPRFVSCAFPLRVPTACVASWVNLSTCIVKFGHGNCRKPYCPGKRARLLLRFHLILAPILLISIVFHGQAKLDHDEFFPLTDAHDVPCAKCHTSEPLLFHVDVALKQELDTSETIPDDMLWWFLQHEIKIPQTAKNINQGSWQRLDN